MSGLTDGGVQLCAPLNLHTGQKNEISEMKISRNLKRGAMYENYENTSKKKRGVRLERIERLKKVIESVDEDKRAVIAPLLDDIIFIEGRLQGLRLLPHMRVHPKNPERQEVTPAGKQYKELMQSYLNAIKVVLMIMYRAGENSESPLVKIMQEFEAEAND